MQICKWNTDSPEALEIPLKRKKPAKWFVNSMSDLFHESVPDKWIDKIFAVMALTPQHTYQVLTKRPERMRAYLSNATGPDNVLGRVIGCAREIRSTLPLRLSAGLTSEARYPFQNIWLGTSVEDQSSADERIPVLLDTPATIRFLSCEPLLGEVDLQRIKTLAMQVDALTGQWFPSRAGAGGAVAGGGMNKIDWVIVGGESGHQARLCELAWIESIVEQCRVAGVACWVKQLGSKCHGLGVGYQGKGAVIAEWPASIRVQQYPEVTQ